MVQSTNILESGTTVEGDKHLAYKKKNKESNCKSSWKFESNEK